MNENTEYPKDTEDPLYGSLTFPIYQTSSFELPRGVRYRYSRENNPTVEALSNKIAEMEGYTAGNSFSSGMGAITTTLLAFLRPGSTILIQRGLFARTYKFITSFLAEFGVNVKVSEPGTENLLNLIDDHVDLVFIETLTNPVLRVNDIRAISEKCSDKGSILVNDSTFTTPYNLKNADFGTSVVLHSASKFLSGHNDLIAGVLAGKDDLVEKIDLMRRNLGASLDPHTAFLVMRGIKTLALRMEKINANALKISEELESSGLFGSVIYPGLDTHPDHDIAERILKGYGGVVALDLNCKSRETLNFLSKLKLIKPANTLGGINTTVTHPATMSHRGLTDEEKKLAGIGEGIVRLSVGIEDHNDLIEDLIHAIK